MGLNDFKVCLILRLGLEWSGVMLQEILTRAATGNGVTCARVHGSTLLFLLVPCLHPLIILDLDMSVIF